MRGRFHKCFQRLCGGFNGKRLRHNLGVSEDLNPIILRDATITNGVTVVEYAAGFCGRSIACLARCERHHIAQT